MCLQRIAAGLCPLNIQVDRGLSVLGSSGSAAASYHLHNMGVTNEIIPFDKPSFVLGLTRLFGGGADNVLAGVEGNISKMTRGSFYDGKCIRCAAAWLNQTESWEASVVKRSVEKALAVANPTGSEVFFDLIKTRYGVRKDDIYDMPGKFMSALKLAFDSSAISIEREALEEIRNTLGISAWSLEDAVSTIKAVATPPTARSATGTQPIEG